MADFHPCLTHKSHNQVNYIPLRAKNNRYCFEFTFAYPRYFLEDYRPSKTYISLNVVIHFYKKYIPTLFMLT